jgi:hypothetical protein
LLESQEFNRPTANTQPRVVTPTPSILQAVEAAQQALWPFGDLWDQIGKLDSHAATLDNVKFSACPSRHVAVRLYGKNTSNGAEQLNNAMLPLRAMSPDVSVPMMDDMSQRHMERGYAQSRQLKPDQLITTFARNSVKHNFNDNFGEKLMVTKR